MSGIEATMVEQTVEMGFFQRHGQEILKVVAAGVGAITMNGFIGGGEASAAPIHPVSVATAKANCEDFTNANASDDVNRYNIDAFLPHKPFAGDKQGYAYETSLFGKNGPLASKGDVASLAAVDAAIVTPAEKGNQSVVNYDYESSFRNILHRFNAKNGGHQAAVQACEDAYQVMTETGEWNGSAAQPGLTAYELVPEIKNGQEDMNINVVPLTKPLAGEEYSDQPNARGVNHHDIKGFNDIVVTPAGTMWVLSSVPIKVPESGFAKQQKNGGSAGANGSKSNKSTSKAGGGGTFGNSSGSGEGNTAGNVSESGGNNGSTPGTAPSFGPGTTPTTGVTLPTTPNHQTPPPTTTPTTQPKTPPTTVPTTTTPTTVPTTTPTTQPPSGSKGVPGQCVPNPPYVIC